MSSSDEISAAAGPESTSPLPVHREAAATDHPWTLDICISSGPAPLERLLNPGPAPVSGHVGPVIEDVFAQGLQLARRLHRAGSLGEGMRLAAPVLGAWLGARGSSLLRVSDWRPDGALVQPMAAVDDAVEEVIDLDQLVTTVPADAPLGAALALLQPVLAAVESQARSMPWRPTGTVRVLALPVVLRHGAVAAIEFHDPSDPQPSMRQLLELIGLHLGNLAGREEQVQEAGVAAQRVARMALLAARVGRGAVITDLDGVIEWVHPAFVQATGHVPLFMRGRTLWEVLLGEADDARQGRRLRDCVRQGEDFVREFVARRGPDDVLPGQAYWLEVDAQFVVDETSGRTQVVCICRDISDRKAHEFGVDEGRALLAALTEHVPISLVVLDAERLQVVSLNHHAETEFAVNRSDVPGWSLDRLLGSGVLERVRPWLQRALDGMAAVEHEFERPAADGVRVISARHVAVRNPLGRPTVVICQLRDVTQQRRDALQLRESEERYRELVESIDEGVFVTTPGRESYFYIGARVCEMLGLEEDMARQQACDLLPLCALGEDLPLIAEQRLQETRDAASDVTVRIRHPQRGVRWLRQRTRTRALHGGEVRVYGLISDVTEERERELQLQAARDAAEAASRAKSQFMATMSHEIRTPMNGILGMTELLLGTGLNERQQRFAQTVYRSGESLLEIINDVLDFAKMEAGKLELSTAEFTLRNVVEDTLELLAPRAHEKGLELNFREEAGLPGAVVADPMRLRQVLTNLVSNAIKFTERGEITVDLRLAEPRLGARAVLAFSVRDTGIGIAPDVVPRLFNAFTQGHVGMSRRYGGTGLGLAISRQLVELMGGTITVRSRLGRGSEFRFTLPVEEGSGAGDAAQLLGDAEAMPSLRVLVVDDHATNCTVLENMLSAWGLRVTLSASGEQALSLLRTAAQQGPGFDLALVDSHMPGMDGIALAEQLRREGLVDATQLVLLSSVSGPDDLEPALAAGFVQVIHKPVRKAELRQAILGISAARQDAEVRMPQIAASVLVVEDNPVNQEVMHQMLLRMGCTVRVASSALEGLAALTEDLFDLVLMDIQMPGMDGIEAMRHLRRGPGPRFAFVTDPQTPVVAVTANALEGDEDRFLSLGFDAYLSKPFRVAQLLGVLGRFLGARLGRRGHEEIEAAARTAPGELMSLREPMSAPTGTGRRAAQNRPAPAAPDLLAIEGSLRLFEPAAPEAPAAPAAPAELPLLDPKAMKRLHDLDPKGQNQLVRRVFQAFDTSITRHLPALSLAPAALDREAVLHVVHTIRSSAASLGAADLAQMCAECETALRTGAHVADLGDRLADLRAEMQRIQRGVQQMLCTLSG